MNSEYKLMLRTRLLLRVLLLLLMLGCPMSVHSSDKIKTIAIAEIMQETNSFSDVATTRADFKAGALLFGEEIIPFAREKEVELGGFLEAVDELGEGRVRVVPIIKARAMSGGPLQRALYDDFKNRLLNGLRAIGELDGIYLSLHGAMGVAGLRDPEGDLIRSVRELVGNDIPIGVSHDLHANVTKERVRHATFIVGYKTNPHRDHDEVGYRVGEILIGTLQGRYRPVMAFNKLKLLKGGGMTVDLLSPMRSIFSRMEDMVDDSDQVLDASNFMVHIWLDDPELGWSTLVVTNDKPRLAQKLADELADLDWSVREVQPPAGDSPSEAIDKVRNAWFRRKIGTSVFCDVADAVGAGAPGENTWILKALLAEAPDLTSYLTIRDRKAAETAYRQELGSRVTLSVGGRLEKKYNRPLVYSGELIHKTINQWGKTVILRHQGIHLIVTELADSLASPGYFGDLGLSLWEADIVVVKNLFPFRYRYLLYNRQTVNVITPGTTSIDVFNLKYTAIPRPIYPLDKIDSWR